MKETSTEAIETPISGEILITGEVTGMGLGLSMVTSVVWQVAGTCNVYNREEGPGIIVELVLPLEKNVL